MRTLVLFTRDLRTHDHPALAEAARGGAEVLPLFVLDPRLTRRSANRTRFLLETLHGLDADLSALGAPLLVARGDVATIAGKIAVRHRCDAVHLTEDVSTTARARLARLGEVCDRRGIELRTFPGHAVVEPGVIRPATAHAYRVFTPYWRAWQSAPRRPRATRPRRIVPAQGLVQARAKHPLPSPASVRPDARVFPRVGEAHARATLHRAIVRGGHAEQRLATPTSGLSPYLRSGVLSALEVADRAERLPEGQRILRGLAWRDFFAQLVAWDPSLVRRDLRPERAPGWSKDRASYESWCAGTTGTNIVDAAMRQLLAEGWMPNRARLIAASYLTRTLEIDWRWGAAHFDRYLFDGDPSSNAGNWQWVAGTGASPRRGVALSMERQVQRFDTDGSYQRRHLEEMG